MNRCPHCGFDVTSPKAVVHDALDDIKYKSSSLYRMFVEPDFWRAFATGRWLHEMSQAGHLILFFAIWPALAFLAVEVALLGLCEVVMFLNRLVFRGFVSPLMKLRG